MTSLPSSSPVRICVLRPASWPIVTVRRRARPLHAEGGDPGEALRLDALHGGLESDVAPPLLDQHAHARPHAHGILGEHAHVYLEVALVANDEQRVAGIKLAF